MHRKRRVEPAKMSDLARLAGVSTSTVSRAMAGSTLVAVAKREEISRLARERGYVVNATARNLRLQRTQALSIVIPLGNGAQQPQDDPMLLELLGFLAEAITQRGYAVILQRVASPADGWLQQWIASHKSDGVIVLGAGIDHAVLEATAASYQPLVVWGGQSRRESCCTVSTDNVGGAVAAVEHLIQSGRKRVVFVGDPALPEIGLRYEGYKLAHERAAASRALPPVRPGELTAKAAYGAMRAYIRRGENFDAVFGAADVIAIGAVRAICAAGLKVPRDVAVVGFGDIALSSQLNPPLTTVRQDLARDARLLVDLLVRRIAGEDTSSVVTPTELVIRESSG